MRRSRSARRGGPSSGDDVLKPIDWIIIGGYLAFSLVAGLVLTRRAGKSTEEFFISGRTLPWWIAGTSMVATTFACDTPLVITGWVREHGLWYNWLWWCFGIAHLLAVFYFSRLWRRAGVTTDVELVEMRYAGWPARTLRAVKGFYFAAIVNTIAMTWVLLAMAKILKITLGVEKWEAVVICAGVAVIYAALSGFWGVVMTDLIQFVIAIVGSVALAWIAVREMGGMAEILARIREMDGGGDRLAFFPTEIGPPLYFVAILLTFQWWSSHNSDGGGILIQRMSASRDERQASLATLWFCIAHYALRAWPWILVALVSILAITPDETPDAESAYPLMMVRYLPPGLMGLMMASLLGAFMSTIDSQVNLASAYFVNDVYRRFLRKGRSERHYVRVARIATVSLMGVAALLAWQAESISDLFTLVLALASGAGAVLILRWFWWRVNAWSEISAMITSLVVAGSLRLLQGDLSHGVVILVTVGCTTAVWLTVTFLTRPVPKEVLVEFHRKVRPPGAWGPVAGGDIPRDEGTLLRFLGGICLVFGLTFGIGRALLLQWGPAVVAFIAAGIGILLIRHRSGTIESSPPAPPPGSGSGRGARGS